MGLVAFTKNLAREGAKYGIKAICIAPVRTGNSTLGRHVNVAGFLLDGGVCDDRNHHAPRDAREPQGKLYHQHRF